MSSDGHTRFLRFPFSFGTSSSTGKPPALYSVARFACLIGSLLVALCAGTNYAFSAYSPQLGARLRVSHTKLNVIGMAGSFGVYGSGPIWGRLVDKTGPRISLTLAFVLLLVGYAGLRAFYDAARSWTTPISTFPFAILICCSVFSGAGGNAGLTGALNTTARSWPDRMRATATAIVLSGFGLSAFFFSALASYAFPGDTSSFLLLLSLGTSIPMLIGAFLVRPIPIPSSEPASFDPSRERLLPPHESRQERLNSSTRLLENSATPYEGDVLETPGAEFLPDMESSLELSRSVSSHFPAGRDAQFHQSLPLDIAGRRLWMSLDFWLAFSLLSILSGTGLMYINNVGSMSQALFSQGKEQYDETKASKWQATQVSTISIFNFGGRIAIGLLCDYTKNSLKLPRSACLFVVSLLMLISQLIAQSIDSVNNLWQASAALGLAYGSIFGLYPTLTLEWFGMGHFSENWGFMSLSPMIGGNLFSLAFGRNLDAHDSHSSSSPNSTVFTSGQMITTPCQAGRECYVATLSLTVASCCVALVLSAVIAWRDHRKARLAEESSKGIAAVPVWVDDETDEP